MPEQETRKTTFHYKGFKRPTTTPVPDDIFDLIAPELTEAELRVLLYIVRRTFGFKKDADAISLTQMVTGITTRDGRVLDRGTGMTRRGVMKGVTGLLEKGIITVQKGTSSKGEPVVNVYSLRFEAEQEGVGNHVPYRREPRSLQVGNEVYPQQTVYNKQNNNMVVALVDRGIHQHTASRLVRDYPQQRILEKIELADYFLEHDAQRLAANPAGFLVRAIEEDYRPPPDFRTQAERKTETEDSRQREAEILKQREAHRRSTDWREKAISEHRVAGEILDIWAETLGQLQHQMPRATFATWLEHTILISLDGEKALVGVQSDAAREWVANRLYTPVQHALATVLGREKVQIEFQVV